MRAGLGNYCAWGVLQRLAHTHAGMYRVSPSSCPLTHAHGSAYPCLFFSDGVDGWLEGGLAFLRHGPPKSKEQAEQERSKR